MLHTRTHIEPQLELAVEKYKSVIDSTTNKMSKHILKHKVVADSTIISFRNTDQSLTSSSYSTEKMLPTLEEPTNSNIISEQQFSRNYQNVHPLLA